MKDQDDIETVKVPVLPSHEPRPTGWRNDWSLAFWFLLPTAITLLAIFLLSGCVGHVGIPERAPKVFGPPTPPADGIDYVLVGVFGLSFLIFFLAIAALIWTPAKKLAGSVAFGAVGAALLSLTLHDARKYVLWFALALAVVFVGALIYWLRKYVLATQCAVEFGADALAAPRALDEVKAEHAKIQADLGVHKIIDTFVQAAKE